MTERRVGATGTFPRTRTSNSQFNSSRHEGLGGFPNPLFAIPALLKRKVDERVMQRTLTQQSMPRTATMRRGPTLQRAGTIMSGYGEPQPVNYISFDAVVGRNSHFKSLTTAQEEELGGVEYRVRLPYRCDFAHSWLVGVDPADQDRCAVLARLPAHRSSYGSTLSIDVPLQLHL